MSEWWKYHLTGAGCWCFAVWSQDLFRIALRDGAEWLDVVSIAFAIVFSVAFWICFRVRSEQLKPFGEKR